MTRAALCVGVDHYHDPSINPLSCAQTDASALYGLFRYRLGFERCEQLFAPDEDAILDAAVRLTRGFGPGDQFVFTFSGHGVEHPLNGQKEHLLLCPKARLSRLAYAKHALPVSLLDEETAPGGFERLFMIDACRSELLRDDARDAFGNGPDQGMQAAVLRDVWVRAAKRATAPLTLFCACDQGERASEVPGARQGLFTLGVLHSLEQALAQAPALSLDDAFAARVAAAMAERAAHYGLKGSHRPWLRGQAMTLRGGVANGGAAYQPAAPDPAPSPEQSHVGAASAANGHAGFDAAQPAGRPIAAEAAPVTKTDPLALLKPERDVFETAEEFEERRQRLLADYQAAVERGDEGVVAGTATLLREQYDINSGRFPVSLAWREWTEGLRPDGLEAIEAERAEARSLWEAGEAHPVVLPVVDGEVGEHAELLGAGRTFALWKPKLPAIELIHGWSEERVQDLQAQTAKALGKPVVYRDRLKDGSEGPELVVIPAGRFVMGSPEGEAERRDNEGPQHKVEIAKPFGLGRYAVTFEEYQAYCRATGAEEPDDEGWGKGRRPVINVSWDDAVGYVEWLSGQTGKKYRLPTEAEWEYGCRAGTEGAFNFGGISAGKANYRAEYQYEGSPKGKWREETVAVDEFEGNRWGLYQMHGNVSEWTCSAYDGEGYKQGGNGPHTKCAEPGQAAGRALRGGFWGHAPWWLRSAFRNDRTADYRDGGVGFRLAQDL